MLAPQLDMTSRIKVGDTVSVAVSAFGEEYARSRGANPWHSKSVRDEGEVIGRENNKWKVRFTDGEHLFERKALSLVKQREDTAEASAPGRSRRAAVHVSDSDNESENQAPQAPLVDSSDEEQAGVGAVGEPDHDGGAGVQAFQSVDNDWRRDDTYGFDERSRHNFTDRSGPRISNASWEHASLFTLAEYFLPINYLTLMAAAMQAEGKRKYEAGDRNYVNFTVSYRDLLQWIGVWIYMLAFPQTGSRRAYFQEPSGGFGPRHRLAAWLRLGGNGEKGLGWFEKMEACFTLPVYSKNEFRDAGHKGDAETDPFRPTRR